MDAQKWSKENTSSHKSDWVIYKHDNIKDKDKYDEHANRN